MVSDTGSDGDFELVDGAKAEDGEKRSYVFPEGVTCPRNPAPKDTEPVPNDPADKPPFKGEAQVPSSDELPSSGESASGTPAPRQAAPGGSATRSEDADPPAQKLPPATPDKADAPSSSSSGPQGPRLDVRKSSGVKKVRGVKGGGVPQAKGGDPRCLCGGEPRRLILVGFLLGLSLGLTPLLPMNLWSATHITQQADAHAQAVQSLQQDHLYRARQDATRLTRLRHGVDALWGAKLRAAPAAHCAATPTAAAPGPKSRGRATLNKADPADARSGDSHTALRPSRPSVLNRDVGHLLSSFSCAPCKPCVCDQPPSHPPVESPAAASVPGATSSPSAEAAVAADADGVGHPQAAGQEEGPARGDLLSFQPPGHFMLRVVPPSTRLDDVSGCGGTAGLGGGGTGGLGGGGTGGASHDADDVPHVCSMRNMLVPGAVRTAWVDLLQQTLETAALLPGGQVLDVGTLSGVADGTSCWAGAVRGDVFCHTSVVAPFDDDDDDSDVDRSTDGGVRSTGADNDTLAAVGQLSRALTASVNRERFWSTFAVAADVPCGSELQLLLPGGGPLLRVGCRRLFGNDSRCCDGDGVDHADAVEDGDDAMTGQHGAVGEEESESVREEGQGGGSGNGVGGRGWQEKVHAGVMKAERKAERMLRATGVKAQAAAAAVASRGARAADAVQAKVSRLWSVAGRQRAPAGDDVIPSDAGATSTGGLPSEGTNEGSADDSGKEKEGVSSSGSTLDSDATSTSTATQHGTDTGDRFHAWLMKVGWAGARAYQWADGLFEPRFSSIQKHQRKEPVEAATVGVEVPRSGGSSDEGDVTDSSVPPVPPASSASGGGHAAGIGGWRAASQRTWKQVVERARELRVGCGGVVAKVRSASAAAAASLRDSWRDARDRRRRWQDDL